MAPSGWGELRPGEESPHGTWEVVRTSADVEVIGPTDPHAGTRKTLVQSLAALASEGASDCLTLTDKKVPI